MKALFSQDSLRILESLTFTKTLFAFDFDGTVSKIVPVPSDAKIAPKTTELLKQLSLHAPVAIVSGRSLKDLKSRLEFEPRYVVGNHGLEGLGLKRESLEQSKQTCVAWKKVLRSAFKKLRDPGLEVEDKEVSLAVHFRRCKSRKQTKKDIIAVLPKLNPAPRVIPGKCVFNLVPFGTPHKGMALADLMDISGVQAAFYIGDDDTDEDVFTVPDARIFTVRVGRKKESNARYFIKNQGELNRILNTLIRFYQSAATHDERAIADARA